MKKIIIIVIFFIGVNCFTSCDDADNLRRKYVYRINNDSGFDFTLSSYNSVTNEMKIAFTLENEMVFEKDSIMPEPGDIWSTEDFLQGDSVTIVFSDGKMLVYKCLSDGSGCTEDHNIFNSFESDIRQNKDFEVFENTYTIMESDYQKAE